MDIFELFLSHLASFRNEFITNKICLMHYFGVNVHIILLPGSRDATTSCSLP